MPFKSKNQARAAFGGYLGPEMQSKAAQWAHETPGGIKSLPKKAPRSKAKPLKKKKMKRVGGGVTAKRGQQWSGNPMTSDYTGVTPFAASRRRDMLRRNATNK